MSSEKDYKNTEFKNFFEKSLLDTDPDIYNAINDELVRYYLNNQISYISIHKIMLKLLKKRYLAKFFNTSPKNINEIKLMVNKVNSYLKKYI